METAPSSAIAKAASVAHAPDTHTRTHTHTHWNDSTPGLFGGLVDASDHGWGLTPALHHKRRSVTHTHKTHVKPHTLRTVPHLVGRSGGGASVMGGTNSCPSPWRRSGTHAHKHANTAHTHTLPGQFHAAAVDLVRDSVVDGAFTLRPAHEAAIRLHCCWTPHRTHTHTHTHAAPGSVPRQRP
jgi:hypothetical protein